jgi:hypothetical protein
MKLWLDDLRPPPDETWTWCLTVEEAVVKIFFQRWLMRPVWTHASLDHDLGPNALEGVKLLDWMANFNLWPTEEITVHSMNPVGRETMLRLIDRYGPYDERPSLFVRRMHG